MTESEWLASTDPQAMLAWLTGDYSPVARDLGPARVSDRKLRLFACACVRQVWHLLTDERSRQAVEVAELFADGMVSRRKLSDAWYSSWNVIGSPCGSEEKTNRPRAAHVASHCANPDSPFGYTLNDLRFLYPVESRPPDTVLGHILRDIVGNPFRPVSVWENYDPAKHPAAYVRDAWIKGCPWITPLVVSLATAAYDNRLPSGQLDPEQLAVLSDALEDAGCEHLDVEVEVCHCFMYGCDEFDSMDRCPSKTIEKRRQVHPLLAHLRSPVPHWRGCWAVDLLLGKE